MGARPLGRIIQEHIKKPLADEILFGRLKTGGTVEIGMKKDELIFHYPSVKKLPPKKPGKKKSKSEKVK